MGILTLEIGVAAIVAAIVGAVASLIAPWANWGVEKRKNRLRWRKGFIHDCKRIINKQRFSPEMFRETSYYSNLRPHLSDKLQKDIKRKRYTPGRKISTKQRGKILMEEFSIKKKLFEEINTLEKKWGLI